MTSVLPRLLWPRVAASFVLLSAAPAFAADDGLEAARAMVLAALPGECDADLPTRFEGLEDIAYDVAWPETDYDGGEIVRKGRLYEINCWLGAYNLGTAYVFAREGGVSPEIEIISFAAPAFSVDYEEGDDSYTQLVRDPAVSGFETQATLVNADFDPESNTISSFSKWRGLGDAYSSGLWALEDGRFVLKKYVIDPVYEANLEDPPEDLIDKFFVLYDAEP